MTCVPHYATPRSGEQPSPPSAGRGRGDGFPPARLSWFVWGLGALLYLIGFRNRLNVFVNWVWNYLTYDRSVRIILQPDGHHNAPGGAGEIAAAPDWLVTETTEAAAEGAEAEDEAALPVPLL